ncbi:MAG: penicillin-binding protein 2 [Anaerolineae bacterium]|nr:penicillin-binding protein 2 [Anaerolineae bacterium]
MAEGPRRRLRLVSMILIGLLLVIVAQLMQVQIINHGFYAGWAGEQYKRPIVIVEPPRGVIRDRNGYLLAGNSVMYSIEADPRYVDDAKATAAELSVLLHVPAIDIERKLSSDEMWVEISPLVSKELGEEIAAKRLQGITVRSLWIREYPEGQLASHVLGFCNAEDRCPYGIEGFYDSVLRPEKIEPEGQLDAVSQKLLWTGPLVVFPARGDELVLTIDRTIQMLAEEELAWSVREYQAEGGTIIVMDPRTFEILALASLPSYDPGKYFDFADQSPIPFQDPAVSNHYEPGSIFKVLTVAAALDSGMVTPETTYYDRGEIEVGGQVIKNASREAYGEQTVSDILIKSLNVGTAWLSTQMGSGTFYRYVRGFGIGQLTGIDLASEIPGQLWLPGDFENWHDADLGTNSFGQGLAVTPIQMVSAVATVANDGTRLRPHVVAQRVAADGSIAVSRQVVEAQPISSGTARQLSEIMVQVVEEEAPKARVEGYRVAGKTGTAQIPIPGGYDKQRTIASFVGFGPVPDPQFVILVKLDRPQTSTWAVDTAAPAFSRLASRLFVVLDIPPDGAVVAEASR